MEQLVQTIGLEMSQFATLIVLAIALVIGLVLLRILFKITEALLRVGCFLIVFILIATFVVMVLP